MPINVTCPSCLKRFTVSDKFAGKTGPCPSCQKTIKIPEAAEQVVIHAPKDSGPTDAKGKSLSKPIRRKDVKIGTPIIVGACLAAFAVLAVAFGLGLSGQQPHVAVLAIGALILAPPLVFLGYWFLHDDELEGYTGQQLLVRCGICSLIFAALWGLYGFVPAYVQGYGAMAEYSAMDMAIAFPVMVAIGACAAVLALELEVVQGVLNYVLYLAVTFLLAWLAGTHLAEPFGGSESSPPTVPAVTAPVDSGTTTEPEDKPNIPNMLQ